MKTVVSIIGRWLLMSIGAMLCWILGFGLSQALFKVPLPESGAVPLAHALARAHWRHSHGLHRGLAAPARPVLQATGGRGSFGGGRTPAVECRPAEAGRGA